jgi:phosphoglycerate-specific signal transduction histidine kinase
VVIGGRVLLQQVLVNVMMKANSVPPRRAEPAA